MWDVHSSFVATGGSRFERQAKRIVRGDFVTIRLGLMKVPRGQREGARHGVAGIVARHDTVDTAASSVSRSGSRRMPQTWDSLLERGGFEPLRPSFSCMLSRIDAHFPSTERKPSSPRSSTSRSAGPIKGGTSRGLAVARETSNVCVHPEKERETDEMLFIGHRGPLGANRKSRGNLRREQLDQAWRDLFGSGRPRRVCGDLLIKALGYRVQEKAIGGLKPATRRLLERWGRNGVGTRPIG